jgi:dephospho-CoA kinase
MALDGKDKMNAEKYVLGVTGSMGCGKSYACRKLADLGREKGMTINYIDADSIRRKTSPQKLRATLSRRVTDGKGLVLFEWALLVEDGLLPLVDGALLVKCDYETQLKRLLGGDLPDDEVNRRINAQLSNDEKEIRIKQSGKKLYVFDSSQNPNDGQYRVLLEELIK